MEVKIETVFGERCFEMSSENAVALLDQAQKYEEARMRPVKVEIAPETKPVKLPAETAASTTSAPARNSRVERLFGEKSTWSAGKVDDGVPPQLIAREKYKGFLHVRCVFCGKEKTWCANLPTNEHKCGCRMITELRELIPVFMKCSCGHEAKYKTNVKDDSVTIPCINCKQPVTMHLNRLGTAYVTKTFGW